MRSERGVDEDLLGAPVYDQRPRPSRPGGEVGRLLLSRAGLGGSFCHVGIVWVGACCGMITLWKGVMRIHQPCIVFVAPSASYVGLTADAVMPSSPPVCTANHVSKP
ncbi:hypothetical protein BD311DRAFT_747406 [Dichomitus squalens]|uniref:Uncharacterized protein n=1 Tax=Dichomitus squalens TaxID=114155 RepID=A0A4Q9N263_9APHY|nr:hypothetical protein BD311DRAFT_747406 [Dichomitus squalens]